MIRRPTLPEAARAARLLATVGKAVELPAAEGAAFLKTAGGFGLEHGVAVVRQRPAREIEGDCPVLRAPRQ